MSNLFILWLGGVFFELRWRVNANRIKQNRNERIKKGISPRLVWTCEPLFNFKYWSKALSTNYDSITLVNGQYSISEKEDFDLYIDDLKFQFPFFKSDTLSYIFKEYLLFEYICKNFDIIHTTVNFLFIKTQT